MAFLEYIYDLGDVSAGKTAQGYLSLVKHISDLLLPFLSLVQSCKHGARAKSATDADFLSFNIMLTSSVGK